MLRKIARLVFHLAVWAVLLLCWCWAIGAALHYSIAPKAVRVLLAIGIVVVPLTVLYRTRRVRVVALTMGVVIFFMAVCWQFLRPSNHRDWRIELAQLPEIAIRGDQLEIRNYMAYNGSSTRTFDLNKLERIWFGVEKFVAWDGGAHNFLTFEFDGDEYVAVSVEARQEKGESYGLLAALFRQFELIYLVGDEAQVFGARSSFQAPTYLYPLRSTPKQRRSLILDICERTNALRERPEWYNVLTNNCTNNLAWHASRISPSPISPYDTRVVFTGHAGQLLYELGMIDASGTLAEMERSYRMDAVAREHGIEPGFSREIRRKTAAIKPAALQD